MNTHTGICYLVHRSKRYVHPWFFSENFLLNIQAYRLYQNPTAISTQTEIVRKINRFSYTPFVPIFIYIFSSSYYCTFYTILCRSEYHCNLSHSVYTSYAHIYIMKQISVFYFPCFSFYDLRRHGRFVRQNSFWKGNTCHRRSCNVITCLYSRLLDSIVGKILISSTNRSPTPRNKDTNDRTR